MKKSMKLLAVLCLILLTGCGGGKRCEIQIVIPAGSTETYSYSGEEISPLGDRITISAGAGLTDTEVILKPVEVREENTYEPTYLTPGMPVEMDVERGGWFKMGVSVQNLSDTDMTVSVVVEDVEVRIE